MIKNLLLSLSLFICIQGAQSQNWSALGSGTNGVVKATAIFQGQLIAGGNFTVAGGVTVNYIAKWDGSTWSALGTGMDSEVCALAVYDGELYAGGHFTKANGKGVNYIARWNGTKWGDVEAGMDSYVTSMVVFGSELIVGGNFTYADTVTANYIVKWDANYWVPMGTGMGGQVNALAVFGNDLIAGGAFSTAGGSATNNIAKWNGSAWSSLGSGINNNVYSLSTYSGNLIAGGLFTTAGGNSANNISKWNGSTWSALGSGTNGAVLSLTSFAGDLIAGGSFTTAGGGNASYIAKWDGSVWSALGNGMGGSTSSFSVNTLLVFGSDLIAGGLFSTAGVINANSIAKWTSAVAPNNLDAGITSIISPKGNYCIGSASSVKVQLKNFSSTLLDTVSISWAVNNVLQSSVNWIGGLKKDSTTTVTLGSYAFTNSGTQKIKAWTSYPNGTNDTIAINDTAYTTDTIWTLPSANAGIDQRICHNGSDTIGVPAVAGSRYKWTSFPAGYTSSSALNIVNPLVTTKYYLTETNANGCQKTDSVVVTVLPVPNAVWSSIANKLSVHFIPSDTTLSSYLWDFGNGSTSLLIDPTNNYLKDSTFTVSLVVTDSNGCTGQYSHNVTVSSIVRNNDAGISIITDPNGNICDGIEPIKVQLQNFGSKPLTSVTISWKVNNVLQTSFSWNGSLATMSNTTATIGNYNFITPGKNTIKVWTSNPNGVVDSGAFNDSAMTIITVYSHPSAITGGNKNMCYGKGVLIGAAPVSGNSYAWTSKPTGFSSSDANPFVNPTVKTTYYLTETNNITGCFKFDSAIITVVPKPDASWSVGDVTNKQVTFEPNNTSYTSYKWHFGDGDSSSSKSPVHTYNNYSSYPVRLTVTNSYGCMDTYDSVITLEPSTDIISNISVLNNLSVFPNPFSNQLFINYTLQRSADIHIDLVDLMGKTVAVLANDHKLEGNYQLIVMPESFQMQAGTYLLRVISDNVIVSRMIIKQN